MPIDASIPLGVKVPDPMQNLSGLLNIANGAQTLQQNQQRTQQGGIDLQERQAMRQVLSDPSNYSDPDGSFNPQKAQQNIMAAAPTTGMKYFNDLAVAHQNGTAALRAINSLTTENRTQIGNALASIPPDAGPDVVGKTIQALTKQYKGLEPAANVFMSGYNSALSQGGPAAAHNFVLQQAKQVLPQETQQMMNTPVVSNVDNGQKVEGINIKPGVSNVPVGTNVYSVQKQLPPTTPTVGPNNQPGYLGPTGGGVAPKTAPQPDNDQAVIYRQELAKAQDKLQNPQKYMSPAELQTDPTGAQFKARAQSDMAAIQKEMQRLNIQPQGGSSAFVPSGPVPGANESKVGSVQVMNDHWARINAGAADAPTAISLLTTIKQLAPGAITGTEAGKRAYWNGLFNALHLGTQATGDVQKDTDELQKAMAQLNLATPATTDAMRTLVEAGRPHSTMSEAAIKDAAGQIEGQIKANMAMRNMLSQDKQYAGATGDTSHYDQKRQVLEQVMDPRIFQYEGLSKDDRKAFMSRLAPQDRASLIEKTKKLEAMGVFQ